MALQILSFMAKYALPTLDCPAAQFFKLNGGEPQVKQVYIRLHEDISVKVNIFQGKETIRYKAFIQ